MPRRKSPGWHPSLCSRNERTLPVGVIFDLHIRPPSSHVFQKLLFLHAGVIRLHVDARTGCIVVSDGCPPGQKCSRHGVCHKQNTVMQSRQAGCYIVTCSQDDAVSRLRTLRLWAKVPQVPCGPAPFVERSCVSHNVRNAGSCISTTHMNQLGRGPRYRVDRGSCATPTLFHYFSV